MNLIVLMLFVFMLLNTSEAWQKGKVWLAKVKSGKGECTGQLAGERSW